jgi:hypothetical protein
MPALRENQVTALHVLASTLVIVSAVTSLILTPTGRGRAVCSVLGILGSGYLAVSDPAGIGWRVAWLLVFGGNLLLLARWRTLDEALRR